MAKHEKHHIQVTLVTTATQADWLSLTHCIIFLHARHQTKQSSRLCIAVNSFESKNHNCPWLKDEGNRGRESFTIFRRPHSSENGDLNRNMKPPTPAIVSVKPRPVVTCTFLICQACVAAGAVQKTEREGTELDVGLWRMGTLTFAHGVPCFLKTSM
jgi:hypothetical protein